MSTETLPALKQDASTEVGFGTAGGFELIQGQAKALSSSQLVPKEYQGNIQNCVVALEIAHRIGASPLMVMQNLYLVHGKPSWSSQFIIAAINSTGKFTPLRFRVTGTGDQETCTAWAKELATDEILEGPPVSIEMAKREGWLDKNGSKWKTMPQLMLRYRAATFFGRLYAPEILMGMQTMEEVADIRGGIEAPRKEEIIGRFIDVEAKPAHAVDATLDTSTGNPSDLFPCPNTEGDSRTREFCESCPDLLGCPSHDE